MLGALSVEPMSGYAIRQAITETLGHFWSESFGQIYPTLARLEADGLVTPDSAGRTSGSTYRLTAAGRRRLADLLREPIPSAPPRNGTLLRLFFGAHLGPQACADVVHEARDRALTSLAAMTAIRSEVERDPDPNAAYWLITVSAGEHAARALLAWAEESLAMLAGLPD